MVSFNSSRQSTREAEVDERRNDKNGVKFCEDRFTVLSVKETRDAVFILEPRFRSVSEN